MPLYIGTELLCVNVRFVVDLPNASRYMFMYSNRMRRGMTYENIKPALVESGHRAIKSCGSINEAVTLAAREYGVELTDSQLRDVLMAVYSRRS